MSTDSAPSLEQLQLALGSTFEVQRQVGRGSMAAVYLAKEAGLDRLVAIKVLLPQRAADETARRRFEREAKAVASLVHPNIVQIYRSGRLPDETPYLAMQYVEGRTMEDRLMAEGPLSVAATREVLVCVASALAAAHDKGIVHRDIRPQNVLWDERGHTALLSDFGIAALVATTQDVEKLTKTGELLGSPRYMSPEQMLEQDVSPMSDIYALGVLGYELLTGEGPYVEQQSIDLFKAYALGQPPRELLDMRADVDRDLATLLRRCLNRQPNHRPRAADLVRMLEGGAPVDDEPEALGLEQLLARRVPQIMGFVLSVAIAVIGLVSALVDVYDWPDWILTVSLVLAGSGVAMSLVLAWFHGEKGDQDSPRLQWALLGIIAVVGLGLCAWVLVR